MDEGEMENDEEKRNPIAFHWLMFFSIGLGVLVLAGLAVIHMWQ
jgi:hypothetical protein